MWVDSSSGQTESRTAVRLDVFENQYFLIDNADGLDRIGSLDHFEGSGRTVKKFLRPLVDVKNFTLKDAAGVVGNEDGFFGDNFFHGLQYRLFGGGCDGFRGWDGLVRFYPFGGLGAVKFAFFN